MSRDEADQGSNRNSQTLMGSIRDFVLGKEEFEGGDDSSEDTVNAGQKSNRYEKSKSGRKKRIQIQTSDLDNSEATSHKYSEDDGKLSLGEFNPEDEQSGSV